MTTEFCELCNKKANWAFVTWDDDNHKKIYHYYCKVHRDEYKNWTTGRWVVVDWDNKLPDHCQPSSFGALKAM